MSDQQDCKYDWLEQQKAGECLEWVSKENAATAEYLDSLPRSAEIGERLRELAATNSPVPEFILSENRLFRVRKSIAKKQGVLEILETRSDGTKDWRLIVDIDAIGHAEGKTWVFRNSRYATSFIYGNRMLLGLSDAGSDRISLREIDLATGELVPGGFCTETSKQHATWLDIDHILISHTLHGSPAAATGYPTATYIWTRGTRLEDAKLVHSGSPTDIIRYVWGINNGSQRYGVLMEITDRSSVGNFYLVAVDGSIRKLPLPQETSLQGHLPATAKHIFSVVKTDTTWARQQVPAGAVVALELWPDDETNPRQSIVYIPEEGEVNHDLNTDGLWSSESEIHLTMDNRGQRRRKTIEFDNGSWKIVGDIPCDAGASTRVIGADLATKDVIVQQSGLLFPTTLWLEHADGSQTELYAQPNALNHAEFHVEQKTAVSMDGTQVDYWLLSPKKADKAGRLPVLMTGYGGHAISMPLSYLHNLLGGISLVPWLESGGALAVALIRGGGERGEEWHQAAIRTKRQKSYDDFAAIAETLIRDGVTSAANIGVFGTSNGGLLAAVMQTQRPDLFGAVISDVPITDMLRYTEMGAGRAWVEEFGDPHIPEDAAVLRAYSPFHSIRPGVKYPPILVTISTTDDRVGAGHARKFVSKLKDITPTKAFLWEEQAGGHGVSNPYQNSLLMARRISFFIAHLTGS